MQPAKALVSREVLEVTWTRQVNVSDSHHDMTTNNKKSLACPVVLSCQNCMGFTLRLDELTFVSNVMK